MWGKRLSRLERMLQTQNERLKVLECPHKKIVFQEDISWLAPPWVISPFQKVCKDCGKVLQTYSTRKEMLAAKLEYIRAQHSTEVAVIEWELKKGAGGDE